MDPDPAIFVIDLQDANKKLIKLICLLLFEGTFTSFFKDKSQKEVTKQKESMFFFFCLMIEGSGSKPLTNGYGSRRPKNIRSRVRNTAKNYSTY
jgi:hypothetical protein